MVTFVLTRTGWKLFDILSLHGISLLVVKCCGFWEKWPPESENIEKHLLKGHFLESICVFWAIVRSNRFTGICCMRVKGYENKNNNKRYATRIFNHQVGADTIFTKLGRVALTRDVITLSKFKINWFINVALVSSKWLKFHVLALLRRTPLTR